MLAPLQASILTGRRPDTTTVGTAGGEEVNVWCWCQRSNCKPGELFMTIPAYFAQNGYVTAGNGKIFHPDGKCPGSSTSTTGVLPQYYPSKCPGSRTSTTGVPPQYYPSKCPGSSH